MNKNKQNKIQTFGVSKDWSFKCRRKYYKQRIAELEEQKSRWMSLMAKSENKDKWLIESEVEKIDKQLTSCEKALNFIWRALKEESRGYTSSYVDLDEVKKIPILNIAKYWGIETHKQGKGRYFCKIRDERTPSCCLFTDKNRFYDFGSGKGGSVIDFYMEITGKDFSEALKEVKHFM